MAAIFSWRKTRLADLAVCLALHPAKNGAETVGPCRTLKAWQDLFHLTHASRSAVVERQTKDKVEIVGFGFAVFVKQSFADAEVRNPQPGLNSRVIENVDGRSPVIATYEEVREANTRGNLQQVIIDTSWKHGHLSPAEVDEVRVLLGTAYQALYAGYHFSRILTELVDELDLWHVHGHKTFRTVNRFEAYRRENPQTTWNPERALAEVTVESMRADPHSIAAGLFQHRNPPQFGFTQGEQELLEVALEAIDDNAASELLFVTVAALKRRWAKIFERVAAVRPDLCPADGEGIRGIQKRQRILAYVRNHPEELRPFKVSGPKRKHPAGVGVGRRLVNR